MYEEAAFAQKDTEASGRSVYGDLQREAERLMKIVEVLGNRLSPILMPERDDAVQAVPTPMGDLRSEFGGLVEQYRKTLGALDRIIKRIEM
jgi:hypothetical protein